MRQYNFLSILVWRQMPSVADPKVCFSMILKDSKEDATLLHTSVYPEGI